LSRFSAGYFNLTVDGGGDNDGALRGNISELTLQLIALDFKLKDLIIKVGRLGLQRAAQQNILQRVLLMLSANI
jgi:hypothetical protein